MSDTDATQARQDVVADVDEILEHVINANMLSMPYDVYYELFDAVAGLGVKVEKLQAENAKLRELCADIYKRFRGVVFECWAYSSEDFRMCEQRMRELGVEVD